ncbi:MAG TPA: TonB family protein [Mesorhizobium sp.]|jgi:protein TonB|uniref:energy transducer TonB family protein n=1 Tax=Mesorhizobium sp. TaxID=1871066 RepID=UPI002DDD11E4|nr:TonB family protein [Mesorhizobium sp.]HEV2503614.1 TonB family protein [Mesorhizobium sp.]
MAKPAKPRTTKVVRGAGPDVPVQASQGEPAPEVPAPLPDNTISATAAPEAEPGEEPARDRSEAKRWLLGGIISLAAHAGIGLYLAALTLPPAADPGMVEAIAVEWVPPETSEPAPKAEPPAQAAAEPASSAPDIEKAPEKPSRNEPVQAQPAPEQDKSPATKPEPQPQEEAAEARTEAQPKEDTAPAPDILRSMQEDLLKQPALPTIAKAPEKKLAVSVQKPAAARHEKPKAEKKSQPRKPAEPAKPPRQERKSSPKKTVTATGISDQADRAAAASPKQPASTGSPKTAARSPVSPAKWQAEVIAHIRRFRQYPPGVSGSASVRVQLRVDAQGVVKSATVAGSSGNVALDRAAVETVKRASPVPAPPPEIARSSMTLAITISFKR